MAAEGGSGAEAIVDDVGAADAGEEAANANQDAEVENIELD